MEEQVENVVALPKDLNEFRVDIALLDFNKLQTANELTKEERVERMQEQRKQIQKALMDCEVELFYTQEVFKPEALGTLAINNDKRTRQEKRNGGKRELELLVDRANEQEKKYTERIRAHKRNIEFLDGLIAWLSK